MGSRNGSLPPWQLDLDKGIRRKEIDNSGREVGGVRRGSKFSGGRMMG